jgi:hypothetical protein
MQVTCFCFWTPEEVNVGDYGLVNYSRLLAADGARRNKNRASCSVYCVQYLTYYK